MKVALFGFGKAGKALYSELLLNSSIESISIFDPDSKAFENVIKPQSKVLEIRRHDFKLNSSYDLVIIASPDSSHFDYLIESIDLGIPTFVEKPYVSSIKQIDRIKLVLESQPEYRSTSNLVMRSSPLVLELKSLHALGSFGKKIYIEGNYLYGRWEKLQTGWRGTKEYSVALGGLIHMVDLASFITNNYDYDCHLTLGRITSNEPENIHDYANLHLKSDKVGIFNLSTNFSAAVNHRRDFAIYGDLGSVEVRGSQVWTSINKFDYLEALNPLPDSGKLLREFISTLEDRGGHTNYPTINEILQVLELCIGRSTA